MTPTRLVHLMVLVGLLLVAPQAAAKAPPAAATLALSPATGPSGTTTTASGRGFAARSSGTLVVGATSYAVKTDGSGAFSRSVPVTGTGTVLLTATVRDRSASAAFAVEAPAQARLGFGVATPGGPSASSELDAVAALVGEQPGTVLSWTDMTRDLDRAGLDAVAARGATPLVTLEPWIAGGGTDQPAYSLDALARGDHDAYLTRFGRDLGAFGRPVLLRFAHEMNGTWYPWSEAVNGAGPGDYVAAWRHVHDVVTAAGATNASWVWSPNVPYPGSVPLDGLWPGAAYVDVVGLDGYNWGTSQSWSSWQSPEQLFGEGLAQVRALAPGLPVVVAETASAEQGGDKAAWVRELVAYLDAQPDVASFVWFHFLKEADWRLDSSAAAAAAMEGALASRS